MSLLITLPLDLHPLIKESLKAFDGDFNSSVLINNSQKLIEDAVRDYRFKEASDIALSVHQLMQDLITFDCKVKLI